MTQDSQHKKTRADYRAEGRMIERRSCADPDRRKLFEANDEEWLRWYFHGAFPKPFGQVHRAMLTAARRAFETGEKGVFVAPRGTGKTTVFAAYTIKLLLCGEAPFPAYLPWDAKGVRKALRFWKNAICFNARISADYPEYVAPFVVSKGSAQRCKVLLWEDTGEPTGAELLVSGGMIVFPDRLGVIGSATINGNPRGLNHATEGGEVWRPSFALIDDAQSKEVARSPAQVRDTIDIIDTDVAGMAGPDARMPIFLLGTVLCRDDVVDTYAKRRDWHCVRVAQIVRWPARMDLWDAFGEMVKDKDEAGAREFYGINAEAMLAGAEVSWGDRYDAKRGEPNAVYSAMRDFYFMGRDAFMAERQGEPAEENNGLAPYKLTPAAIVARAVKGRAMLTAPDWVTRVVASTDVNPSYALSTVIVGFGEDQTAAVLWHGIHPVAIKEDALNAKQFAAALFAELARHGREIAACSVRPEQWAIDCGGKQFDGVLRFADSAPALCGIQAHGFRGHDAVGYNPGGKTARKGDVREGCHGCFDIKDGRRRRWVAWNTDYWKEIMQRAWLGESGAPGSASLYEGVHEDFAAQVANESVVAIVERRDGQKFLKFHKGIGNNNFCDAMAQAYAMAAYGGIGTGGKVERRKPARVVISGQISKETERAKGEENAADGKKEQQEQNGAGGQKRRVVIGRPGGRRW